MNYTDSLILSCALVLCIIVGLLTTINRRLEQIQEVLEEGHNNV